MSTSEVDWEEQNSELESGDGFDPWHREKERKEELQVNPPIRYYSRSFVLQERLPQSTISWRQPSRYVGHHHASRRASSREQVSIRSATTKDPISLHVVTGCLIFSNSSKNPKVYLRWETNMEKLLRVNNISKERKLSYSIDGLVGDAYKWWDREKTFNYKLINDWDELKARMYKEFVK